MMDNQTNIELIKNYSLKINKLVLHLENVSLFPKDNKQKKLFKLSKLYYNGFLKIMNSFINKNAFDVVLFETVKINASKFHEYCKLYDNNYYLLISSEIKNFYIIVNGIHDIFIERKEKNDEIQWKNNLLTVDITL